MQIKRFLNIVCCCILGFFSQAWANVTPKPTSISVAILATNQQQMQPVSQLFERYNRSQSEVVVTVDFYSDEAHKSKIGHWLENGDYDLIHWQAGKRLNDIVAQELIQPIDALIDSTKIRAHVSARLIDVVSQKGSIQGLPFGYYPWGFYYSKPIFKQYSLTPPESWAEFIAVCHRLKLQGVDPIVQANQAGWPLLTWIDFLALDNGGAETRNMATEFNGMARKQVDALVEQFSYLLEHEFFFAAQDSWRWEQTLPLIKRQFAAMTLIGQFAESEIQAAASADIGYFPFPYSEKTLHKISVAPIDLWIVPVVSTNHELLAPLLEFLMQPSTDQFLANTFGFLPVHPTFDGTGLSERARKGLQQLRQSDQLVQYFDRDADDQYARTLAASLAYTIKKGEASSLKSALLGQEVTGRTAQQVDSKIFNMSSITGARGTFFVSNLLEAVYKNLGYGLSVTRYSQLSENLDSYQTGADGELVRTAAFSQQSTDLIRVPEPISEATFYLVCSQQHDCSAKLPLLANVGTSMELVSIQNWWQRHGLTKQSFVSTPLMLEAFLSGQINFMVLTELEVSAFHKQLGTSSFRTIVKQPFYHFIHKKHAAMLNDINQELINFKQSDEYQALRQRYWLN